MDERRTGVGPFYKGKTHVGAADSDARRRGRGRAQKVNNATDLSKGLLKTARTTNVYAVQIELFIFCANRNTIAQKKVVTEMGDESSV